jgi:hypothetical protein
MPKLVWLVLLLFPMALGAESSGYVIDETILLNSRQHDYKLIHSGIINRSESVRLTAWVCSPIVTIQLITSQVTCISNTFPKRG